MNAPEDALAAMHDAVREWKPGAKQQPSHGGHIIVRYLNAGLLTGTLRPVWRCSCDPRHQYGIYDETSDCWNGGPKCSPEEHIKQMEAGRG